MEDARNQYGSMVEAGLDPTDSWLDVVKTLNECLSPPETGENLQESAFEKYLDSVKYLRPFRAGPHGTAR